MKLHPCRSLRHHHLSPLSTDDHNHSLVSQPSLPSIPTLALQPYSEDHFHYPITTLKSHSSAVFSLAFSPNHLLFSAAVDGEVCRHNPPSSSSSSSVVIPAANYAVKCIQILHNKLITAHQDHKIRIWRIRESESSRFYSLEATLPTLRDRARAMMSSKSAVKIRRHVSRTWVFHADAVSALALSIDQTLLYSVSWDRSLKIWRTSDFRCVESIPNAHDDAINAITTSIDGRVFTGSADRSITVWKKKQSTEEKLCLVSTLTKHKSAVNALAVSSDGTVLYSGACDTSVLVWESDEEDNNGTSLVVIGALRGHTKAILCLCVAEDLVCSGSADGTIRVWRRFGISGYRCLAVLGSGGGCGGGGIKSVVARVVEEGRLVVYGGSLDGEIRVWEIWVC